MLSFPTDIKYIRIMKKRLETKLFSNGAEFLVMAKLLLSNIETYKAYVNFEGYDLMCKSQARFKCKNSS